VPYAYEWAVLRVVPRVDRCEFVNVGVLVYCQGLDYLAAQVTDDLTRALALDPALDVETTRRHLQGVRALCAGEDSAGDNGRRPVGDRFRWLVAPRSTVLQPSPVHTGLSHAPAAMLTELFERMVTSTAPPAPTEPTAT
jgi:Protein of unknown function (DUF3037)